MDNVTRMDIERDGLERTSSISGVSTERQDKHAAYLKHLKRMESDEDYRHKWMQNERDMIEAQKRNMYY